MRERAWRKKTLVKKLSTWASTTSERVVGTWKRTTYQSCSSTKVGIRGTPMKPESVVHFTDPFDILYDRETLILGSPT
jgi:hypothetical protein